MVSMLAVPEAVMLPTLYQIVLAMPVMTPEPGIWEQAGTGSAVCVVAPELSCVFEKFGEVIVIAFAKVSFGGAAATTTNVGNVTIAVVTVVPPPGGGFCTPTELVLPELAMKVVGTVAVSCVALTMVVAIGVPPVSGFISTL